jgi:hypothetical protein
MVVHVVHGGAHELCQRFLNKFDLNVTMDLPADPIRQTDQHPSQAKLGWCSACLAYAVQQFAHLLHDDRLYVFPHRYREFGLPRVFEPFYRSPQVVRRYS